MPYSSANSCIITPVSYFRHMGSILSFDTLLCPFDLILILFLLSNLMILLGFRLYLIPSLILLNPSEYSLHMLISSSVEIRDLLRFRSILILFLLRYTTIVFLDTPYSLANSPVVIPF